MIRNRHKDLWLDSRIEGFMEKGLLQGSAVIRLRNRVYVRAKMRDGVMHGFAHSVGTRITMPLAREHNVKDVNDPNFGTVAARDGNRFHCVLVNKNLCN